MNDASGSVSAAFSAEGNGSDARSERAQEAAAQAFSELKDRAADYIDAGREQAVAFAGEIEKQIRERPLPSLAVAAGIGFALGLLYNRRS